MSWHHRLEEGDPSIGMLQGFALLYFAIGLVAAELAAAGDLIAAPTGLLLG